MKNLIRHNFLLAFLSASVFMANDVLAQNDSMSCSDWQSKVDSDKPLVLVDPAGKSQKEILFAIDCLLHLEGKKELSNVEGASNSRVSTFFGATSVEVAALYYASYLYYQRWNFADAPFLVSEKNHGRNRKGSFEGI
jgi:hypothetical protein